MSSENRTRIQELMTSSGVRFGTSGARGLVAVECDNALLYVVPQRLSRNANEHQRVFFFRSADDLDNATLTITKGGSTLFTKRFAHLRPPEMERLAVLLTPEQLAGNEPLRFHLEVTNDE